MSSNASWLTEDIGNTPPSWSTDATPRANRERNKRLRTIYEDAGLDYGDDVEGTLLSDRFKVALDLRKKNIKAVLKNVHLSKNVDMCFLIDATGSMQEHIDGVRDSICQIVNLLTLPIPAEQNRSVADFLRVSCVAYRDFDDKNQFEILDFTKSVEEFKEFCKNLKADGGQDEAEDVFGGIEKTLNLKWSGECGTKIIFHICDAPCHGKKYYDEADDYHAEHLYDKDEKFYFNYFHQKKIDYYFGKINNSTNKMIKVFSEAYPKEIMQFNIKEVKDITDSVFTAVSTSLIFSTGTQDNLNSNKMRSYTLSPKIPDWDKMEKKVGRFIKFTVPKSLDDILNDVPLVRNKPILAAVQIAPSPFAKGSERYAFYGRDVTDSDNPKNIIIKEYILNSGVNPAARFESSNQIQTVATYFAEKYNEVFEKQNGYLYRIEFLKVQTLCIQDKEDRYFSCEKQYNGEFVKFTNNADYLILQKTAEEKKVGFEFIWALTAFSHWTYQVSFNLKFK